MALDVKPSVGGRNIANLPLIEIHTNGYTLTALVDTGASVGVIREELARKLDIPIKPTLQKVRSVNGQSVPVCGQITITMQLGSRIFNYRMIVLQHVVAGIIIAYDFVKQLGISIDGHTGGIHVPFAEEDTRSSSFIPFVGQEEIYFPVNEKCNNNDNKSQVTISDYVKDCDWEDRNRPQEKLQKLRNGTKEKLWVVQVISADKCTCGSPTVKEVTTHNVQFDSLSLSNRFQSLELEENEANLSEEVSNMNLPSSKKKKKRVSWRNIVDNLNDMSDDEVLDLAIAEKKALLDRLDGLRFQSSEKTITDQIKTSHKQIPNLQTKNEQESKVDISEFTIVLKETLISLNNSNNIMFEKIMVEIQNTLDKISNLHNKSVANTNVRPISTQTDVENLGVDFNQSTHVSSDGLQVQDCVANIEMDTLPGLVQDQLLDELQLDCTFPINKLFGQVLPVDSRISSVRQVTRDHLSIVLRNNHELLMYYTEPSIFLQPFKLRTLTAEQAHVILRFYNIPSELLPVAVLYLKELLDMTDEPLIEMEGIAKARYKRQLGELTVIYLWTRQNLLKELEEIKVSGVHPVQLKGGSAALADNPFGCYPFIYGSHKKLRTSRTSDTRCVPSRARTRDEAYQAYLAL